MRGRDNKADDAIVRPEARMPSLFEKWTALKGRVATAGGLRPAAKPMVGPTNPRHDDLYLVEFPKSGVTWLCFLMANTNLLLSGDETRQVTFFNLHGFIPEINVSPHLADPMTALPGFRIIKSHAPSNFEYPRVIYLVRDPRDVMVSFHAFLDQTGWFRGSLDEVIDHPEFGIGAWTAHVSGWLDNVPSGRSFALLRYEDMLADPGKELRALYRLIGFDLADAMVDRAVERSSIDRMRALEAEANSRHPANARMEFVRKGATGQGRNGLPAASRRRIETVAAPLLERLGYPL
jgi:hypothetical protein